MASGVLVAYRGRETKFWLPCTRDKVGAVVASHHETWKREEVKVDGENVQRSIPAADLVVTYCTGWKKNSAGADEMVNPEPIDVTAFLSD